MKIAKDKRKKSYSFTHYELNEFVKKVCRQTMSVYIAACVEEFGWTKPEIDEFFARLKRYMDAVDDNLISLRDIERMIEDEIDWDVFKQIYS